MTFSSLHAGSVRSSGNISRSELQSVCKAHLAEMTSSAGVEAIAVVTGLGNKGRVSEWTRSDLEHFPQPWRIVAIERFCGSRAITEAMVAAHGCVMVEDDAEAVEVTPKSLGEAARQTGEAIGSLGDILSAIKSNVADRAKCAREITDAIRILSSLRAALVQGDA